jgi:hypothetical protein
MLFFPASILLLPAVLALGVVYVRAEDLGASRVRLAIRLGILLLVCLAPAFTRGPGPAQLILGLILGYLGLRMVAITQQSAETEPDQKASARRIALELVVPQDVLVPTAQARRRPMVAVALGVAGVAACIVLLILGNEWRLWQQSLALRFLDDLLVVLEVAVGAAGVHRLMVGVAGLYGRSVVGLEDSPFRSTSLTEFWARRWNRMVQANLKRGFFKPLARAGHPGLGVLAAFTASGVLHVMAVAGAGHASLIALPSLSVMGFFLLHSGLVLIEKRLGWDQPPRHRPWRLLLARVRAFVLFVGFSPLLIEPFACVVHVHGRAF